MKIYIIIMTLLWGGLGLFALITPIFTDIYPKYKNIFNMFIGIFILIMVFVSGYIKGLNGLSDEYVRKVNIIMMIIMIIIIILYSIIVKK